MDNIEELLKKLNIDEPGTYKNHFYVIFLKDSNEYAKMYTNLDKHAVNTEYPEFTNTSAGNTTNLTTYFETELDGVEYSLFLMADFNNDVYKLKISEK